MHLVLDFDSTITVNDTIDALAQAAVNWRKCQGYGVGAVLARDWQSLVEAYVAEHRAHVVAYQPAAEDRTTLAAERTFQASLKPIDGRSLQNVQRMGLFSGMPVAQLEAAGQQSVLGEEGEEGTDDREETQIKVVLRRGFSGLLAEATTREWPVSIVSINWSDAWVRGVVSQARARTAANVVVYANTLTASGGVVRNFGPTADVDGPLNTATDKLQALAAAVQAAEDGAVMYMGDSTTDMECLIHAATEAHPGSGGGGIAVTGPPAAEGNKLVQTLKRLGYRVPHVSEAETADLFRIGGAIAEAESAQPRLAWARDFDEILASGILGQKQ